MKRGNISILVIFVLLASSLLGILAMNFVQQMMKQSAIVHSYYKTYYLSKAGIELGLVEINHRGIGFEYTVNTGDALVFDNFLCGKNCSMSTSISGTSSVLSKNFWQGSGCEFPYVLSGGDSLIVPLFRDVYTGTTVADIFATDIQYINLAEVFQNQKLRIETKSMRDTVTFGLVILSGDELYENGIFFKSGSLTTTSLGDFTTAFYDYMKEINKDFASWYGGTWLIENGFKIYFLISNTADGEQSLCLYTDSPSPQYPSILPTESFFIQSHASYGNQHVWLDASYAQPIPGFLLNTYSSF